MLRLPRYERVRPGALTPENAVARVEESVSAFADGLTGPSGVLARGLTWASNWRGAVRTVSAYTVGVAADVRIGDGFPASVPSAVWLLDALDANGVHWSNLGVKWSTVIVGNAPAVRVHEVVGLGPGSYALVLLFFAE